LKRVDGILPDVKSTSAIYSDLLTTSPLSVSDDGRAYQCTVIINSCTNSDVVKSKFIVLDFPGEQTTLLYGIKILCLPVVPSCYISSGCNGNPLNQIITFSECCTKFSGVSYNLESRCQPCPTGPSECHCRMYT